MHVVLRVLAFSKNVCGVESLGTVPSRAARWYVACSRNRTTHTEHGARSGEVRLGEMAISVATSANAQRLETWKLVSALGLMTTDIEMHGTMRAVLRRSRPPSKPEGVSMPGSPIWHPMDLNVPTANLNVPTAGRGGATRGLPLGRGMRAGGP